MKDLSNYRKSYEKDSLLENQLPISPLELFKNWFTDAENSDGVEEANAMTISTISNNGYPNARVVLLKQFNEDGFVFYTNYNSKKGKSIAENNKVGISFFWPALERQIIINGIAEKTASAVSDAYFSSRPKGSQMGAIASPQSQVIPNREFLEEVLKNIEQENKEQDSLKRPEHWGGYIVKPTQIEFWQGRANRLHDRIVYTKEENNWVYNRLAP